MTIPSSETWNRVRWAESTNPCVESLFLKFHLPGNAAFWARYTLRRPAPGSGPAVGCLWAVCARPEGTAVACNTHPASEVDCARTRFWLRIGPGELSTGRATGRVDRLVSPDGTSIPGDIAWDLTFETGPTLVHLPLESLYAAPLPRNKIVSPLVSTRFHGTIRVQGTEVRVVGAPGMQGHNWGAAVSPSWAWCHVAGFDGEADAVFEALNSGMPMGPVEVPLTLLYLRLRGREHNQNHPVRMALAKSSVEGLRWRFEGSVGAVRLDGEVVARPGDAVGLDYLSSDGSVVRCVNSNLASARVRVRGLPGGERVLATEHTATLELGGRSAPAGVPSAVRG